VLRLKTVLSYRDETVMVEVAGSDHRNLDYSEVGIEFVKSDSIQGCASFNCPVRVCLCE
jgi:hypothetical protein